MWGAYDQLKSYAIDERFSAHKGDCRWDGSVTGEVVYRLKKHYSSSSEDPILEFEFQKLKDIEVKGKGTLSPEVWESVALMVFESAVLYELDEYFGEDTPGYSIPSFSDIDHSQDILSYSLDVNKLRQDC